MAEPLSLILDLTKSFQQKPASAAQKPFCATGRISRMEGVMVRAVLTPLAGGGAAVPVPVTLKDNKFRAEKNLDTMPGGRYFFRVEARDDSSEISMTVLIHLAEAPPPK